MNYPILSNQKNVDLSSDKDFYLNYIKNTKKINDMKSEILFENISFDKYGNVLFSVIVLGQETDEKIDGYIINLPHSITVLIKENEQFISCDRFIIQDNQLMRFSSYVDGNTKEEISNYKTVEMIHALKKN